MFFLELSVHQEKRLAELFGTLFQCLLEEVSSSLQL
jgi:hypothetical protein